MSVLILWILVISVLWLRSSPSWVFSCETPSQEPNTWLHTNAGFMVDLSQFWFLAYRCLLVTQAFFSSSDFFFSSGLSFLPFPELKKQSISTLEREWDTQSTELGTSPSCGGVRSVVRTRHQPGRSLGRSSSSTVWPADKSSVAFRNC